MKKIFVFCVVGFFLFSCHKKVDVDNGNGSGGGTGGGGGTVCSGPSKSFATDVNPIIQNSCATSSGCHGSGSNSGPGPLLNYTQISSAKSSIRSAVESGSMPRGSSLSATQKNTIICWIDNGALNN